MEIMHPAAVITHSDPHSLKVQFATEMNGLISTCSLASQRECWLQGHGRGLKGLLRPAPMPLAGGTGSSS